MAIVKHKYWISEKDEVPKEFYGMDEVFEMEKFKTSKEKAYEIKKSSLQSAKDYCVKNNIYDIVHFWRVCNDRMSSEENAFYKVGNFALIAHLVEMFCTKKKNATGKKNLKFISFGIRKSHLNRYLESGCTEIIEKKRAGRPRIYANAKYDYARINIGQEGDKKEILRVRKNPVFMRFKAWCDASKISMNNGTLMAMDMIMNEYKNENVPSLEHFQTQDEYIPEYASTTKRKHYMTIDSDVLKTMNEIIKNYNSHPDNHAKEKFTISRYIEMSINKANGEMPLKYSNPESYKLILKEKEMEKLRIAMGLEGSNEK